MNGSPHTHQVAVLTHRFTVRLAYGDTKAFLWRRPYRSLERRLKSTITAIVGTHDRGSHKAEERAQRRKERRWEREQRKDARRERRLPGIEHRIAGRLNLDLLETRMIPNPFPDYSIDGYGRKRRRMVEQLMPRKEWGSDLLKEKEVVQETKDGAAIERQPA